MMNSMEKAFWERTADGKPAQIVQALPPKRINRLILQAVAKARMTEITMISATFGGVPVLFEPWVEVLLMGRKTAEFVGVYLPAFPCGEQREAQPCVCLRKSLWNGDRDLRQYSLAENKKAYLENNGQVESRIVFPEIAHHSEIHRLVQEIQDIFRQGVNVETVNRSAVPWYEITCKVLDKTVLYSVSYTPFSSRCEGIEAWISKWHDYLDRISSEEGYLPDMECRVSYRLSLADRIEMLS